MSKIKFCGLTRECDIEVANELNIDYIGFVFVPKRRRYVNKEQATKLKRLLKTSIRAVGVFVNEQVDVVADLLNSGVIDIAQLHGTEDEAYISKLRTLTAKPIIKAFILNSEADVSRVMQSTADYVLLDSGTGTGNVFDWSLVKNITRDYFLAGGLSPENVGSAILTLNPFALDVSSGIETEGVKDPQKMRAFINNANIERNN